MKKAAIIEKTQRITKTIIAAVINGIMSPKPMLLVLGVTPDSDGREDQSPFQLGKTFIKKFVMLGRTIAIPTATATATPTTPEMTP